MPTKPTESKKRETKTLTLHSGELLRGVDIERRGENGLAVVNVGTDDLEKSELQAVRSLRPDAEIRKDEESCISGLSSLGYLERKRERNRRNISKSLRIPRSHDEWVGVHASQPLQVAETTGIHGTGLIGL